MKYGCRAEDGSSDWSSVRSMSVYRLMSRCIAATVMMSVICIHTIAVSRTRLVHTMIWFWY